MEEILDTFDIHENFLGSKSKSECHKPNVDFYHRVVWVWLINDKKEILIQQRALTKKHRAGCWDEISIAGHVSSGETTEQACMREISEEIGVNTKITKNNFATKWIHEQSKEIVYFYVANIIKKASELVLQTSEVADAKYISFKEFKEKLNNNFFGEYPKDYKTLVIKTLTNVLNK